MCAPIIQRTLIVTKKRVTINGGKKPVVIKAKRELVGRDPITLAVESVLSRMSLALQRANQKPWMCEVTVKAPVRLNFGFARHGIRVRFPETPAIQSCPSETAG